jgi:deazaflavin-dependent oxidoreductase (nitroreductase family)
VGQRLLNLVTGANVLAYRLSGGRLGAKVKGAPVLLLDHVGAKSGKHRTTPVLYTRDGDTLVVVASRGGSDANPGWFHNLVANPETSIRIGSERRNVRARVANPEERELLWPRCVEVYSDYAVYEQRTDREIPVVLLERA